MRTTRPIASVLVTMLSLSLAVPGWTLEPTKGPGPDEVRVVHVLNRLAYGPRPGDVEKVRAMGLDKWIEQQLHPERLSDPEPARRLADLSTIHMSPKELVAKYDVPPDIKRELQKKQAEMEGASEEEMRRARREFVRDKGLEIGRPQQVIQEMQTAKLLRAIYSERQLDEVLVDFWMNHFNVFANKGPVRYMVAQYERETIRPHAWGKFEDLLRATAESPAMLFYLDNWLSAAPRTSSTMQRGAIRGTGRGMGRGRRGRGGEGMTGEQMERLEQIRNRTRGLNENYAREILELHTLGVDGGYTQKDVTEVARCFTGWTIQDPRGARGGDPAFVFRAQLHDDGDKVVLGRTIKSNGREEGLDVIHMLATHPSTARFISYKLARRFVSDEPPKALVERAAAVFTKTDGDIREVVKAIVTAPEFFAAEAQAAKVKTPLEFVVSAIRASGAEVRDGRALNRYLERMGMPLYLQQPPTGYKDTADAWVSTSGLLSRLNFALDLAAARIPGVQVDARQLAPGAADAESYMADAARTLLPNGVADSTREVVNREASGLDAGRIAGLLLGSPEFQRR